MKKLLFAITLSVVTFLFASCGKDDDKKEDVCYLNKVSQNGKTVSTVTFNADNKPVNVSSFDNLGLSTSSIDIEYNGKSQPIKLNNKDASSSLTSYNEYQYNVDGLIGKASNYSKNSGGDFELSSYNTYEYDTEKRLIKNNVYQKSGDTFVVASYDTYQYGSDKNIVKSTTYQGMPAELYQTVDYEYDTKHSYLTSLKGLTPTVEYLSENNVTKTTIKDKDGTVKSYSLSIAYVYNDNGYPVKVTQTPLSGDVIAYDIEYDCK